MPLENISVSMIRATLADLPQFDLPTPYTLRWYTANGLKMDYCIVMPAGFKRASMRLQPVAAR